MPIIMKDKIAFIHIPKTGGSSIAAALKHNVGAMRHDRTGSPFVCDEHWTYERLRQAVPRLDTYFSFAIVRNPWDRMFSEWKWRRSNRLCNVDFKVFAVRAIRQCRNDIEQWDNHWRPQVDFLNENINFIGRFERFDSDVKKAFSMFGKPIKKLPRKNY